MRHNRSMSMYLGAALAVLLLGGCKSEEQAAKPSPSGTTPTAPTPTEPAPTAPTPNEPAPTVGEPDRAYDPTIITVIGVDLDPTLAELCGVDRSKLFFKFDSAQVTPAAKDVLGQIATCATSGPLKGKELTVVGRTDPRGGDEYNKQLGMSRAESVAKHLKDQGVAMTRVETESRGEQGAAADPAGWPADRRVTIRVQK